MFSPSRANMTVTRSKIKNMSHNAIKEVQKQLAADHHFSRFMVRKGFTSN